LSCRIPLQENTENWAAQNAFRTGWTYLVWIEELTVVFKLNIINFIKLYFTANVYESL